MIQKLEVKRDMVTQAETRAKSINEQRAAARQRVNDLNQKLELGQINQEEYTEEAREIDKEVADYRQQLDELSSDINSLTIEGYDNPSRYDFNENQDAGGIIEAEISRAEGRLKKVQSNQADERERQENKKRFTQKDLSLAKTDRFRSAEIRQKETVALYLPHKLNVAGFNTYDTPSFSVLGEASELLKGNFDAMGPAIARRAAGFLDSLGDIAGGDINAQQAIQAVTGKIINPRRETLFQAPEMRKFEFAFEFTPRNLEETYAVDEIIRTFKRHAYPSRAAGGVLFDMPAEFALEYYAVIDGTAHQNAWLNKIARCVLAEINVDYTGAGSVSMFHNGAPTHINLTLSFQETELITQEYVVEGY